MSCQTSQHLFFVLLDVIRDYGSVVDSHCNRVYSHIMKRYLPCAILPTKHLALEMMLCNNEKVQRPMSSQALPTWRNQQSRAQEKGTLLNHPHFIFVNMSQNTSTSTHPQARTTCCNCWVCPKMLKPGIISTERKLVAPRHSRDQCGRMSRHESRLMAKLVTS